MAFIITKTGNPVACRIRDRSEDGARLFVDSVLGIPNQFRLVVQKTGEDLPVTVVWRGPQEIGVAFVETQAVPVIAHRPIAILPGPETALFAPEARADGPFSGAECDG